MFGSVVLDVAIGLIFVYLMLSLVCSALREAIEARLKTRSVHLQQGITAMLDSAGNRLLSKAVYEHPMVFSLFKGAYVPPVQTDFTGWRWIRPTIASWFGKSPSGALPSYIPTRNFAIALLDLAAKGAPSTSSDRTLTVANIRAGVAELNNPDVQRVIETALDTTKGDIDAAILNIQDWFDSSMDRVSGWYKRESQQILFWIGLVLVVALNVDTIAIVRHLATSETARSALVTQARDEVGSSSTLKPDEKMDALSDRLLSLNLPIGWDNARPGASLRPSCRDATDLSCKVWPYTWQFGMTSLAGWLLTAFAISFGAPFWFDMLNKVMVIRSTVKPHEKSPEEASDDRQTKGDPTMRLLAGLVAGATPAPVPVTAPRPAPAPSAAQDDLGVAADDRGHEDGCDVALHDVTPDAELPAAKGGVL